MPDEQLTLKDVDEMAKRGEPILWKYGRDEIVYPRIVEVGWRYDKDGTRHPFAVLEDKNGNSRTRTYIRDLRRVKEEATV